MTPLEFRAWRFELRDTLKDVLPNRDALLWVLVRYVGLASAIAAQFPFVLEWFHAKQHAELIEHLGAIAAFVGASMGWSWGAAPTRVAGPGTLPGTPKPSPTPQELENARTIAAAAGQPPPPPDTTTKGDPR